MTILSPHQTAVDHMKFERFTVGSATLEMLNL